MYLTKQEKCRIQTTEPGIPNVGLGKYLDGYDSSRESKPIAGFFIMVPMVLFLLGFAIFSFYCSIAPSSNEPRLAMAIFGTIFLALACYFVWSLIKPYIRKEKVYVYENGFLWSIQWRNDKVIKEYRVCFDDVATISCPRTDSYAIFLYSGTEYRLKVVGKNNKDLFFRIGKYLNENESPYKNGWDLFSLDAILNQWTEIGVKNMTRELNEKGQVKFDVGEMDDLILTRETISLGGKTLALNDVKMDIDSGQLTFNSASEFKGIFGVDDISFNVNEMPNGSIFLKMLANLAEKL